MDFLDLVKKRSSVRKYLNKPVEKEKIEKCLEAARLAPSASNSQPWHYVVITEDEVRGEIARETYDTIMRFNKFTETAPVLIVIVQEKPNLKSQIGASLKKIEFPLIDIGISAEHFCLQAAELGLGTCMLGWFQPKNIKKLLRIPSKRSISLMISLGYPDETIKQKEKKRLDLNEMSSFEKYHSS